MGLALLIDQPWLALLPAAGLGLLSVLSRRRIPATAAVAWVLYAAYELGMKRRWLCSGECNIRVDLLLLYPALLFLSIAGVVSAVSGIRRRRPAPENP
jgi:hypothetical protein